MMRAVPAACVAAGLTLAGFPRLVQAFECPSTYRGARLDPAQPTTLFDGAPEEQASLAPEETSTSRNRWKNVWTIEPGGNPIVAVCYYAGGAQLRFPLPPTTRKCTQQGTRRAAKSILCD